MYGTFCDREKQKTGLRSFALVARLWSVHDDSLVPLYELLHGSRGYSRYFAFGRSGKRGLLFMEALARREGRKQRLSSSFGKVVISVGLRNFLSEVKYLKG